MSGALRVAVLGSTGSIGRQALDVASRMPDRVRITALAVGSNHWLLAEQARACHPIAVALDDPEAAHSAAKALPGVDVGAGPDAVVALASHPEVDVVLNALVGAAGLRATMAALSSGKVLALANKESLVVGGELVTALARPGNILPVDSEHSAIFQCLLGEDERDVERIWLTASGGPFRGRDRTFLAGVDAAAALAHPTWTMGPKITVDSATLMNKGLEAIEAHHLFAADYDRISIVVHPQSCVHSMVEFADGSVKAHLGATDMRIPIQYAFSHPRRWPAPIEPVDFTTLGSLDFEPPDVETFRCLALALEAGKEGGTLPAVLNAANEIAVEAFLAGRCRLTDIDRVVETVMNAHEPGQLVSVEQVEAVDRWARDAALKAL
ncbi:MAG: 1-deoxy-D-xylulose-5-phosphate reductoisomerase [Anaerosomatales bacterium]|nr:1-deoxy-D-xylulose-5-phosphate reductoisomerase [Anaerosomatales bacterium]MDT8433386.1 1-deoxy-D-xylulose-5-phosphate reductoisomerase [Anaerosomatales bacterium]